MVGTLALSEFFGGSVMMSVVIIRMVMDMLPAAGELQPVALHRPLLGAYNVVLTHPACLPMAAEGLHVSDDHCRGATNGADSCDASGGFYHTFG